MPQVRNRSRRAGGSQVTVPLQVREPIEVRDIARRRADELGLSMAQYFELLLRADEDGAVVTDPWEGQGRLLA